MKGKILNLICILFAAASFMILWAAGSSIVVRNRITDMLLRVWWMIPLVFLAADAALYHVYAGILTLLYKGAGDGNGGPPFMKYLFMVIAAVMESGVVLLLRYMIGNLLTVDNPHTGLAAGGCVAACSFMLLSFLLLLLGSAAYGCSWEAICDNTERGPAYLAAIGLATELVNIIVWCIWFI